MFTTHYNRSSAVWHAMRHPGHILDLVGPENGALAIQLKFNKLY